MSESLTKEELDAIAQFNQKTTLAKLEAEKAVALAKLAEVEATNLVLRVYNKYQLKAGIDRIAENGTILRQTLAGDPVSSVKEGE